MQVLLAVERLPHLGANDHLPAGSSPLMLTLAVGEGVRSNSHAQAFLVGVFDLLVGLGKTFAGFVDLLLGEIFDHEEVLNGVACFAQVAVSCDDVRAFDHATRLPPKRCGVVCDRGCVMASRVALGRSYAASVAGGSLGFARVCGRK